MSRREANTVAQTPLGGGRAAPEWPAGLVWSLRINSDWRGRQIRKRVRSNATFTGPPSVDLRFVYDGWNLIAVLGPQSSVLQSFVWGLDLSGTLQGAGGVGGLLQVTHYGTQTTNCFVAFDGNGNVVALVHAPSSMLHAQYQYGPFAEPIRATGPLAAANSFRFSAKYEDAETDLLYYGYRYYSPTLGRWLSRDPIWELQHPNLHQRASLQQPRYVAVGGLPVAQPYAFCRNDGIGAFDVVGLFHDGGGGPGTDHSGHADFSNVSKCPFDYTLEDRGATAPYPGGDPERHFRDFSVSEEDVRRATMRCDADAFQRAMHRGQDYFVHFGKGYRWDPWNFSLPCWGFGHACEPEADFDAAAWRKADAWPQRQLAAWLRNCCVPRCGRWCSWAKRAVTFCHPQSP